MPDANRSTFKGDPYVTGVGGLKLYSISGVTAANGSITFTIPAGTFTTMLTASAQAVRNTADPTLACFAVVRSLSATQVVVQVFESKTSGILLGGTVEGLELATSAVTVLLTAVGT